MELAKSDEKLAFDTEQPCDLAKVEIGSQPNPLTLPEKAGDPGVLQAVIDQLIEQVALVDASGRIVMVNTAWLKAASTFDAGLFEVGKDYRSICSLIAEQGYELGYVVLEVLREFEAGLCSHFEETFSIPGPAGEHFYHLGLSTVDLQGTRLIAVTSYEITEFVALRRRNHELEGAGLHIQQEERRRIAREIHDTTAQDLAVLHLSLSQLKTMHGDEKSAAVFDVVNEALNRIVGEIRTISYMLHPPPLERGLIEALDSMSRGFAQRTKLRVECSFECEVGQCDERIEQALYRVAQEALANVYRHAGASKVTLHLLARSEHLHLIIEDDGIGIVAGEHQEKGVGLAGMRARVEQFAGHLSIEPIKCGTRLTASIPLSRNDVRIMDRPALATQNSHQPRAWQHPSLTPGNSSQSYLQRPVPRHRTNRPSNHLD